MKLWPFVVVVVGLVLAGTVYIFVREPGQGESTPGSGRELPRLPLDRVVAPLPPRFAGPLPSRVEDFHQEVEKGPPLSYVRSRLLEGDPEMEAKFLSALRQAADSAWNFGELWGTYGVVLGAGGHEDEEPPDDMLFYEGLHDEGVPCAWLRARLAGAPEENPLLAELLWRKLVRCPGPEASTLFAQRDAPITLALDHRARSYARCFTPRWRARSAASWTSTARSCSPGPGPISPPVWSRLQVSQAARGNRGARHAQELPFRRGDEGLGQGARAVARGLSRSGEGAREPLPDLPPAPGAAGIPCQPPVAEGSPPA